jgi:hypothetical protein
MNLKALLDNPAVVVGLVRAGLILLISFGVAITTSQQDAILQATGALLAVISLVLTGVTAKVTTPKAAPTLDEGTVVNVVTPEGIDNYKSVV